MTLPEVDHLQDKTQSQSFVRNQKEFAEKSPSAMQREQGANTMRTDLITHLGNERRLPRNKIGDPRRGPELVGHFSVDGWPGLWTLKENEDVCENMDQIFDAIPNIWRQLATHPRRLVLGLLGFPFAVLHRLLWLFLLVAVLLLLLLLLLFFLLVLLLLFRSAEPAVSSSPRRHGSGGLQVDAGVCRPVGVLAGRVAVQQDETYECELRASVTAGGGKMAGISSEH